MIIKKKNYHYFVSGLCCNEPFMTEVLLPKKTSSYTDVEWINDACAKKYDVYFDDIVITNYKLLRRFRY